MSLLLLMGLAAKFRPILALNQLLSGKEGKKATKFYRNTRAVTLRLEFCGFS
jgi:hypothetical protein